MKEKESKQHAVRIPGKYMLVIPLFIFALALSNSSFAQDFSQDDEWKFGFGLYGWYGNMAGDTADGSKIDEGADDLLDALSFGGMGALGAYKGRWGFMVDLVYINVEDDTNITVPSGGGALSVNTNVDIKNWIVTPMIGYKVVQTDTIMMHVVGGARYLSLDADVDIHVNVPTRPLLASISDSGSVWDGIVGVKGELSLNERWYIPFYLDIGTGESDFTWQANAGLGYRFEVCDVVLSYRHLSWNFDDNPVLDNMNISGPLLGVKFAF